MKAHSGTGIRGRRVRKEAIDVPEEPKKDRRLDQLILVHEHRLQRLERERQNARTEWRETRRSLSELKERWRNAQEECQIYWQDARRRFFAMQITSGEFRHSKAVYERLKQEAAELKLNAMRHIDVCKDARTIFFTACHTLKSAYLHIEKLKTLRDEMRREQQEAGC